jgi:hypothetical protein
MRRITPLTSPRFALVFTRAGDPGGAHQERVFASEEEARDWAGSEAVIPVRLEHLVPVGRPGRQRTFMRSRYPF